MAGKLLAIEREVEQRRLYVNKKYYALFCFTRVK